MILDLFISLVDGEFLSRAVDILVVIVVVLVSERANITFYAEDLQSHDNKGNSTEYYYDVELVF